MQNAGRVGYARELASSERRDLCVDVEFALAHPSREAQLRESLDGSPDRAVSTGGTAQAQGSAEIVESHPDGWCLTPKDWHSPQQQDRCRSENGCPASLDVRMVEREPSMTNLRPGMRRRVNH
jgi:hypothetical protein